MNSLQEMPRKAQREEKKQYRHFALQAALMHPGQKQVLPIMAESVENSDGSKKQDCEINAVKRMIPLGKFTIWTFRSRGPFSTSSL